MTGSKEREGKAEIEGRKHEDRGSSACRILVCYIVHLIRYICSPRQTERQQQ